MNASHIMAAALVLSVLPACTVQISPLSTPQTASPSPTPSTAPAATSTPATAPAAPAAAAPAAPPATGPVAGQANPAAPPPPPTLPYPQAVMQAANGLFGQAKSTLNTPVTTPPPRVVVIDPLIDGMTGAESAATREMGTRLAAMIKAEHPQFEVLPFNAANVAKNPLVLIGTFTGVNAQRQTSGSREAFRICLALADLKSGKLVGKGLAFARPDGVDVSPTPAFGDAPAWTEDPATLGYIRTCQGTRAGDPINALYADRIVAAALVAEAVAAYDAGRYAQALQLFESARKTPGGDQLRVRNGLYLSYWRMGQTAQAERAFGDVVDFGLAQQRLAVKFLFRPGSTAYVNEPRLSGPYPMWLRTIGQVSVKRQACLEVVGHTSASGPEPLNERLSQLRADAVADQLRGAAPQLSQRLITRGMGSKQTLVGNGRDDASDALDRRVEFRVIAC